MKASEFVARFGEHAGLLARERATLNAVLKRLLALAAVFVVTDAVAPARAGEVQFVTADIVRKALKPRNPYE